MILHMCKEQIPIYFSFDNNYAVPAAIAFFSLLKKKKESVIYNLYVLHSDISIKNQNKLQEIVNKFNGNSLNFINTKNVFKQFWNKSYSNDSKFTVEALTKCFAAKFFPNIDKIIFSDVDVIFADDISDIYHIDLENKYLAGVLSPFLKFSKDELSHFSKENYDLLKDNYIAGGIWVLNLSLIRQDDLESKMINILQNDEIEKRWIDQDVMNLSCIRKTKLLPLNYISYPYLIDLLKDPLFESHYSESELYDSILSPKIIHFAAEKPWAGNPNYSSLWWSYFEYLKLKPNKIFKESSGREVTKLNFKLKKYKRINLILIFVVFFLFILFLLSILL